MRENAAGDDDPNGTIVKVWVGTVEKDPKEHLFTNKLHIEMKSPKMAENAAGEHDPTSKTPRR